MSGTVTPGPSFFTPSSGTATSTAVAAIRSTRASASQVDSASSSESFHLNVRFGAGGRIPRRVWRARGSMQLRLRPLLRSQLFQYLGPRHGRVKVWKLAQL